jgi:hypothetical protein
LENIKNKIDFTLYKIYKIADKKTWDEVVSKSSQYSLLCSSNFLNGLTCKYDFYFIKKENQIKLAVLLFKKSNKLGKFYFQDFNYNQGFYFFDNDLAYKKQKIERFQLVNFFLDYISKKVKEMRFSLHSTINDIRAFQWYDYAKKPFHFNKVYTSIIDFSKYSNFENFLSSIRYERRRENRIFKEQSDLKIIIDNSKKNFIEIYKYLLPAIGHLALKAHIKLIDNALKNKYARINFMYSGNKIIAATLFYFFKKDCYYAFSVTDPNHKKKFSYVTSLILEQINFAFQNKITKLDFLGVNSPNRADYKESFGGNLDSFYELIYKKK